jgi:hypothetical protein
MRKLDISALGTLLLSADGLTVALSLNDESGEPLSLRLPTECLQQLLLTIPAVIRKSLQLRFRDNSLRHVYPLGDWTIEEAGAGGALILTMYTPDGFEVAFGFNAAIAEELGGALEGAPAAHRPASSRHN